MNHPELIEDEYFKPQSQAVVTIPQKSPEGAITRTESAMDLLRRVEKMHKEWIKPGHRTGRNTHNDVVENHFPHPSHTQTLMLSFISFNVVLGS